MISPTEARRSSWSLESFTNLPTVPSPLRILAVMSCRFATVSVSFGPLSMTSWSILLNRLPPSPLPRLLPISVTTCSSRSPSEPSFAMTSFISTVFRVWISAPGSRKGTPVEPTETSIWLLPSRLDVATIATASLGIWTPGSILSTASA